MTSGSKSRQLSAIVFATVFLLGLVLIAWQEYYPSSPMFETIGIPGPRANSGRRCGRSVLQTRFGNWPTRDVSCHGPNLFPPGERHEENVGVDLLTRQTRAARRFWSVPDSIQWQQQRDSIPLALARLGGREISCLRPVDQDLPWLMKSSYWKFPSYYVRMTSYEFSDSVARGMPRWDLQLDGYSNLPQECGARRFAGRPNGCDSGEMTQLHLPGGWRVCFRNPLGD
jgi:hypothetical protein